MTSNQSGKYWAIMGTGAFGCLWATFMDRAGIPCRLLGRQQKDPGIQHIIVSDTSGQTIHALPYRHYSDQETPLDFLLMATKAPDTLQALQRLRNLISENTIVLLLQNGLVIQQAIADYLPDTPVFCAVSTEGVNRVRPFEIIHAGRGLTWIGPVPGTAPPPSTSQALRDMLPLNETHIRFDQDMQPHLWRKFAINCAINPLTAIYQCRNGELEDHPQASRQLSALCDEIHTVATSLNLTGDASQCVTPLWRTREDFFQQVMTVIRNTASNRSSMLQDVIARRPTEIAFLNAHLTHLARQQGIPTPVNNRLVESIRKIGPAKAGSDTV